MASSEIKKRTDLSSRRRTACQKQWVLAGGRRPTGRKEWVANSLHLVVELHGFLYYQMMCADRKGKVGWKARERKRILASHMKRYVRERYECTAGVADTSLG